MASARFSAAESGRGDRGDRVGEQPREIFLNRMPSLPKWIHLMDYKIQLNRI